MLRGDKDELIAGMRRDVESAAGVLFLDYTGLTVDEAEKLRRKLRPLGIGYRVVKNTLLERALEGTPMADAAACLKGSPTGVMFGFDDPVKMAQTALEFAKDCAHVRVKGGVLDKKALSAKQAEALSKMPSRVELQGMILGAAMSPGRNLLGQIKSPSGKIVGAIDALVKKLSGEG